ncbi:AraC family transcriptional regulator [Cohnella sp. WQ 127256]|uniref:AraC family transcriptional regulator n=1 Tax=Cohnella sp. WQ 127256 TaxID=2938790 RepID=UPI00211879C2|nr:AraC family transcriptional regulator [Cohnella sp. WQ 127256]
MTDIQSPINPTPRIHQTLHTEGEFRIDLPFDPVGSSIYYLGLNVQDNWATQSHYHEHFELCYLDEGNGQYKIDKTLYDFRSGQLLLTKPGESHYGLASKPDAFKLYYVGFKLDRFSALQLECYRIGMSRIADDPEGTVKSLFVALINETEKSSKLADSMAEALLQQLLITALRRLYAQEPLDPISVKPLRAAILETMNRLHEAIRYDQDIDALAAAIPISRSHLTREFKNTIGLPLGEYIRNLCLSKATTELRETDKSVSEIAADLGFASIHSFSIFFKRFTALTPTEYRKSQRIGH